MLNLHEYRRNPDRLSDVLPWAALIAPGVILNKDGSFQTTISYRGPDLDSATPAELVHVAAHVNNALKRLGSGWAIFAECDRTSASAYPSSSWDNSLAALIDENRRLEFESNPHFESAYYLTLLYLPPADRSHRATSLFLAKRETEDNLAERSLSHFVAQAGQIIDLLDATFPEVRILSEDEVLTYLHGLVSDSRHPVRLPEIPMYMDAVLPDSPLTSGNSPKLGDSYLGVVGVLGFPSTSEPGLLNALNNLPFEYRWTTRFLPMDSAQAQKEIEDYKRKWFGKRKSLSTLIKELCTKEESILSDSDAILKSQDADSALQALGEDSVSFGYFTMNIVLKAESESLLRERISILERVINGHGFVTKRESINTVDAWLGTVPGNTRNNVRRPILHTLNLAHLLPGVSSTWSGPTSDEHFQAPPVFFAKTAGNSPFRFALHVGDVGHTLVLGPTGSGKSTLLGLLEAQFLRYPNAQIYIFDKGGSARTLTRGIGGDFYDLGNAQSELSLQPLGMIHEECERTWALEWLVDICLRENLQVTPQLKRSIWDALNSLSSAPRSQRTLYGLTVHLQHEQLRRALQQYTYQGAYGHLLDSERDNLRLSDWQCFEMESLMDTPSAMMPVLSYLFHRLEERFNGRPTLLVLDEAWLFLDHSTFALKIREWLKTLRKKNVSVIFATQSLADVDRSSISHAIKEACFTKIYLPNSSAAQEESAAFYHRFGLNERQIEILSQALPKRDYYYTSPLGNRLFQLGLDQLALSYLSTPNAAGRQIAAELMRENLPHETFNVRFLESLGLAQDSERLTTITDSAERRQVA